MGIPIFVLKTIKNFGDSHVFFTSANKKVLNFFGFFTSSLGGMHLISEIAQ